MTSRHTTPEIRISSEWNKLLSSDPNCPHVSVKPFLPDKEIILLNDVFSQSECSALVSEAEKHGFGHTDYPHSYRGNLRLITTDFSLADALWARIKNSAPLRITFDDGEYEAVGLNEVWRIAKYRPGDKFCKHCDASFVDKSRNIESMFTVNIYMNGGFEGGETSFHLDGVRHDITPHAGLCLLFRQPPGQSYYHEVPQRHYV